jgi:ferrous iron transport protein A
MSAELPVADSTSIAQPGLSSLGDLPAGTRGVVRQLRGGKEFTGRVATLGFTLGAEITVVENYGRGPIIAMVRDTRVALGRGESAKIQVEVLP